MAALPPDYDSDPGRWLALDRSIQRGDVHEIVAAEIARSGIEPVADVGGGDGALLRLLPNRWKVYLVDRSPAQLARAPGTRVRADATALPFPSGSLGAVAMLWVLYHLDDPLDALREARRVLRPGGLLVTSTASRRNDPELTDGYERTTFDAEEAPAIVAEVFDEVRVDRWDRVGTHLRDRAAVLRYCGSHRLPARAADRVTPPVWLTKRGCLVRARA